MNQERYVIFTTEENQGLETFLGSGEKAECVVLGYTPEEIARKMKFLGISAFIFFSLDQTASAALTDICCPTIILNNVSKPPLDILSFGRP